MKNKAILISAFFFLVSLSISLEAKEKLVCCYYDITHPSSEGLSKKRLKIIQQQLQNSEASVVMLAGIKDKGMLEKIQNSLSGFIFAELVEADDKESRIALISKIKPEKFEALTNIKYTIKKDIELPVQRGFIHAVFNIQGYRFHLYGANLKNRKKHPLYNQTDMRRYEARKIRKIITDIIKADKSNPPNILLLAGLNDTCGKSPIKDVYNRRFGIEKRLFDLRPVDSMNVSWNALDASRDEYERIDYAIISSGMMPEIILDETMIIENESWNIGSLHRPLVVTINCQDKPVWIKEKIDKEFPHAIRSPGFKIGQKRKRGNGVKPPHSKNALHQ